MTGAAGVDEMEDDLAAWHRPIPKHSTCLARIA